MKPTKPPMTTNEVPKIHYLQTQLFGLKLFILSFQLSTAQFVGAGEQLLRCQMIYTKHYKTIMAF